MTTALNRRQLVIGVLLCTTLAATAWVSQGDGPDTSSVVPPAASSAGPRTPVRREAASAHALLSLDKPARRASDEPGQNAFVNRTWFTPPPPVKELAPAAPSAPLLPFTYMGKMQEGDKGPLTVYLVQGERAYNVKKGDVIDDTYRIESIDAERIVLKYLPLAINQTLSFGNG